MGQKSKLGFGIMDSVEFVCATNAALRFDVALCYSRHCAPPPFQIKFQRNNQTKSICVENIQYYAYECVVGLNCA